MNFTPSDNDLRSLSDRLGIPRSDFEKNRKWLSELWESCVQDAVARGLGEAIHRRVMDMMTPPPSLIAADRIRLWREHP